MNIESLYNGITETQDDLIDQAAERRRRQRLPILAAILALTVLVGIVLRPAPLWRRSTRRRRPIPMR